MIGPSPSVRTERGLIGQTQLERALRMTQQSLATAKRDPASKPDYLARLLHLSRLTKVYPAEFQRLLSRRLRSCAVGQPVGVNRRTDHFLLVVKLVRGFGSENRRRVSEDGSLLRQLAHLDRNPTAREREIVYRVLSKGRFNTGIKKLRMRLSRLGVGGVNAG